MKLIIATCEEPDILHAIFLYILGILQSFWGWGGVALSSSSSEQSLSVLFPEYLI